MFVLKFHPNDIEISVRIYLIRNTDIGYQNALNKLIEEGLHDPKIDPEPHTIFFYNNQTVYTTIEHCKFDVEQRLKRIYHCKQELLKTYKREIWLGLLSPEQEFFKVELKTRKHEPKL